jgi:molecular chaperone DnaJ
MQKNYYVILGVTSDASVEEIKAAFRRRAREVHPDRSGFESGPFLEVQEAYGVLSDPERRRRYDGHGDAAPARRRPWGPAPEPLRAGPGAREFHDISLVNSFESYRPSFDELFDRLWSNFALFQRPKSERLENLTVEVTVSAEEARRGGRMRILIPGRGTCAACGGRGAVGPYACWRCDGRGALATDYPVEVPYPPGIRDGHAIRISLSPFGIENLYLTVLFRAG